MRALPLAALIAALLAPDPASGQIATPTRGPLADGPGAAALLEPTSGAEPAGSLPMQSPSRAYGLTAGLGFGTRGGAGVVAGSFQFDRHLLSARASGTVAFFGDELWDIGILYGRAVQTGVVHLSLGAGIAAVGGSHRETLFDPGERIPTTVGLPVEAQLFFRPVPVLGVGVYGFGNFNDEESFLGAVAAVQLGRFW
jgi:hypothetical protein